MARKLKENEYLVCAGNIGVRVPNGTPLPSIPYYIIVSIDKANPTAVVTVNENERVILAGHILHHKQRAEERFAAYKAGREIPPKEESTPLYIITDAINVNPQTGLLIETSKACVVAGKDLAKLISIQKRKEKALERQANFKKTNYII